MVLNMIDLTTLEGMDTAGKVKQLCYKAQHLHDSVAGIADGCRGLRLSEFCWIGQTGTWYSRASKSRPSRRLFPAEILRWRSNSNDVKMAVDQGADEIDMVISRGKFHHGDYQYVFDEIAAVKEACGRLD